MRRVAADGIVVGMGDEPRTETRKPITVLIVDDHPAVREAIRLLLETQGGVQVVASAASVSEAVALLPVRRPAVILLDISLPGENGLDAIPVFRQLDPGARVLMYSLHDEPAYAQAALRGGADGYVVKDDPAGLLDALAA